MIETRDSIKELISEVLARRGTDPRYRSAVERGLQAATEHYAYPWVLRFVDNERDKTAYLRAAALCAAYRDVPQANLPLGVSLKKLSLKKKPGVNFLDPAAPDLIAVRLASFQEQELDEAAATIRRFLDLARGSDVGFDFYGIGRLLSRWGNGFTEASQKVRTKTIGDYYGAWTNAQETSNNNPAGAR